jgi:hypothetical protein
MLDSVTGGLGGASEEVLMNLLNERSQPRK